MVVLQHYAAFGGMDWERGALANALASKRVIAPHTGKPISEALLWGVSGGSVIGYFPFAYQGIDPHVALLINNTFTPFETIVSRLNISTKEKTTGRAARAAEHLHEVLADGDAALVWVDFFSLPYNLLDADENSWVFAPVIVYGVDDQADRVYIADRSRRPLWVTRDALAAGRGRTQKNQHRLVILGEPDFTQLRAAVEAGLRDSVTYYMEGAPKGSKDNWGLAALEKWAALLMDEKSERGWHRLFPRGGALYNGLLTAHYCIAVRGVPAEGGAGRAVMADFLDEAAVILERSALNSAAAAFRATVSAWNALAAALLPDDVPLLSETRRLELQARALFMADGMESIDARRTIKARLAAIREQARAAFPLDDAGCRELRETIREQVLTVRAAEAAAVEALRAALA